jgi:hypothetical protein
VTTLHLATSSAVEQGHIECLSTSLSVNRSFESHHLADPSSLTLTKQTGYYSGSLLFAYLLYLANKLDKQDKVSLLWLCHLHFWLHPQLITAPILCLKLGDNVITLCILHQGHILVQDAFRDKVGALGPASSSAPQEWPINQPNLLNIAARSACIHCLEGLHAQRY